MMTRRRTPRSAAHRRSRAFSGTPAAPARSAALALLVVAAALSALAGAGCGRSPAAEAPKLVGAVVDVPSSDPMGPIFEIPVTGSDSLVVGTGPFDFWATLEAPPDVEWYKTIKVSGGRPETVGQNPRQVCYHFPAGPAGEKTTITLSSVVLPGGQPGPLVLELVRAERVTASLKVKLGDSDWRDAQPGEALPKGPLKFLLTFSGEVGKGTVYNEFDLVGLAEASSWNPDGSLTISLTDPPATVDINLSQARDANGLPFDNEAIWGFYVGEPPRLFSVSGLPGGGFGSETGYCSLPGDLYGAAISPANGEYLLAGSYVRPTVDTVTWLIRPGDGSRKRVEGWYELLWVGPGRESFVKWETSGSSLGYQAVDTEGEIWGQGFWAPQWVSVSPDGERVAAVVVRPAERTREELAPADLVVTDLGAGRSLTFEAAATLWVTNSVYKDEKGHDVAAVNNGLPGPPGGPAWSPDGRQVALVSDSEQGSVVRVLDAASGEVVLEVPLPEFDKGSRLAFTWSPDGRYWTAGPLVVKVGPAAVTAGSAVEVLPGRLAGRGRVYWSPGGEWLVETADLEDWSELTFYNVDPAEGAVPHGSLGPGLPCGWTEESKFYFVRWDDYEQRYVSPY